MTTHTYTEKTVQMALASRFRIVSLTLAAAALSSSLACSLILDPRDDVQRCGNVDDCETPADTRFEAVCISDPGADIDTTKVEQVCVAQFREVNCDPMGYDADGEFNTLVESRGFSDYACPAASDPPVPGVQGCPPEDGCAANLQVIDGICDDPNAEVPTISLNSFGDLEAQDVKDQFCRGFFCDEEYVCNSTRNACERCDPDKDYGEGGCGMVFTQGVPSCVYASAEGACAAPDAQPDEPVFGDCG
ncbi:MAG: hypothetical protein KUG77_28065 [Nannocystaceae bacterium]|nr:hypothetical protein [Nannocystaceae bacterium]